MPAGGYFRQALVVDVTDGTSRTLPLPDDVLRAYIGGAGLGTWLRIGSARLARTRWAARRRWRSCSPRWPARDQAEVGRLLTGLGPDALGVGTADFARLLESRRGAVKAVLVDQHVIAGLGNLLADEILWRARIHPPAARRRPRRRRAASAAPGDARRAARGRTGRPGAAPPVVADRRARPPRHGLPTVRD